MPFATTHTVALNGAVGHLIDVQADVSSGQVATVLVGRPDAALNESRDRCRMAIINSQFDWPSTRRTTILLSPADLPKRGTHYDLAIAVAVLGATGVVPRASLEGVVFIGELTLAGGLRSVPGRAADGDGGGRSAGHPPRRGARAAGPRGGDGAGRSRCSGMRSLAQVVAELRDEPVPEGAAGGRDVRHAGCCRGAVTSGWRRSTSPTSRAWRTRATPSRWRRRAATTCCSPAPRGRARPASPSGSPGCSPT